MIPSKHIYLILLLGLSMHAFGQTANDSTKTKQLEEVVVKGAYRTQKGDTLCVVPSANQRKFSFTGYELLRSLMLPGLRVNTVDNSLSLGDGGKVVVLIDGREIDSQNIMSLRSKDVARVEYIEDPGPDYGYNMNVGALINIVLKVRTDGYAAAVVTNNAVTTANGGNFAFGKYTNKNSELELSVNSNYTSITKRRVDDSNTYMMEDDNPYHITYKGMDTRLKYTDNTVQLEYNHYVPNDHIFDATLKGIFYYSPDRAHEQQVSENNVVSYYQRSEPYEKNIYPSLNLYYKKYFTKNSILTANLVGGYKNTVYHYGTKESDSNDFDNVDYTYFYGTKSRRQSYIGEVKYRNRFNKKFSLNVGARVNYSYTSNSYDSNVESSDHLHETGLYAYVSADGYFGKLRYVAGIGLNGWMKSQNKEHYDKFKPRPQLQLSYNVKGWKFRLSGSMTQQSPSLSEMASTEFRVNRFELKRGNPDLKDWWLYKASFRINKSLWIFNLQNTLTYENSKNPVSTYIERIKSGNETLFVTSYENQKRFSVLSENLNIDFSILNQLNISAGVNFNSYQSRGNNFSHNLNAWSWNASADWFKGHWNVGLNFNSRQRTLSGEMYNSVSSSNAVYVNYVLGNSWKFGIMGMNLFSKNGPTFKDELRNRYMTQDETIYVPAFKNMIMLNISWNFSCGKQRKAATIDMTNEDNQSGIMRK